MRQRWAQDNDGNTKVFVKNDSGTELLVLHFVKASTRRVGPYGGAKARIRTQAHFVCTSWSEDGKDNVKTFSTFEDLWHFCRTHLNPGTSVG